MVKPRKGGIIVSFDFAVELMPVNVNCIKIYSCGGLVRHNMYNFGFSKGLKHCITFCDTKSLVNDYKKLKRVSVIKKRGVTI